MGTLKCCFCGCTPASLNKMIVFKGKVLCEECLEYLVGCWSVLEDEGLTEQISDAYDKESKLDRLAEKVLVVQEDFSADDLITIISLDSKILNKNLKVEKVTKESEEDLWRDIEDDYLNTTIHVSTDEDVPF